MDLTKDRLMIAVADQLTEEEYIAANQLFQTATNRGTNTFRIVISVIFLCCAGLLWWMDGFSPSMLFVLGTAVLFLCLSPLLHYISRKTSQKAYEKQDRLKDSRTYYLYETGILLVSGQGQQQLEWEKITLAAENRQMFLLVYGRYIIPLLGKMLTPSMAAYLHDFIPSRIGAAKFKFSEPIQPLCPEGQPLPLLPLPVDCFAGEPALMSFQVRPTFGDFLKANGFQKTLPFSGVLGAIVGAILAYTWEVPPMPGPWIGSIAGGAVALMGLIVVLAWWMSRQHGMGTEPEQFTVFPSGIKCQNTSAVADWTWDRITVRETKNTIRIRFGGVEDVVHKNQLAPEAYEELRRLLLRFNASQYQSPGGIQPR